MKSSRINDIEYKQKYIDSKHYVNNVYQSKIIDNFLSNSELAEFEKAASSDHIYYVKDVSMAPPAKKLFGQSEEDHVTAHYYIFASFYDNPAWSHLVDILQPKLEQAFGSNIFASHIHVLESHFPYGLHNDAEQPNMIIAPEPAWTLIIPLDDYPSKTYVFNERSGFKDPRTWANHYNISPAEYGCIDDETFSKDFDPITDPDMLKYLTVESIFHWKKGSCFAADRYRYHCSDNFYNHGINCKRAIIMWTSIKKDSV